MDVGVNGEAFYASFLERFLIFVDERFNSFEKDVANL